MNSETKLYIVENQADVDAVAEGCDTFVIESALQEVPAVAFERVFRSLIEADPGRIADLPLYGVVRIHLAFLFAQNQTPPMALPHLVVLYTLLEERLNQNDYDELRCHNLAENYQAVVSDVASKHSVTVENTARFGFHRTILGFLIGIYGYFRLLADQLLSIVWKRTRREPDPTETVFVPHVNRFDNIRPVLDQFEGEYEVVLPTSTISWLRHRKDRYADVDAYDPTPLDYFTTPRRIVETIRRGIGLTYAVLIRRSFDVDVQSRVRTEFGVEMPQTVTYLLGNLFAEHIPALANTVIAEQMLADLDPEQLVVGSLGSRQQAILYAAIEAGVDTYHVPHSGTNGYEKTPPSETVHFVPGDHIVTHLQRSDQLSTTDNVVPAGRPKLVELSHSDVTPVDDWQSDAIRIVVATQPFSDPIRRRFIEDVLESLQQTPEPIDVVIKIHPNETTSFYVSTVSEYPFRVRIAEDDIYGYVTGADVVVTINSNVGLESMVLGTPCVCVNVWSPLIRARPYATHGPVPVLRTNDEMNKFFATLTADRVGELAEAETDFVRKNYLAGDPSGRISAIIQADDQVPN
ncbi:hypothetical protein [Halobacterium bonnevillei]|uniref:Capsule polysaccharide biosynthesis protein n=1 Tax=Halobacterium bonnevillei TaxID=2692200 RepID=A0A6B0SEQ0_9EURY|nr:hypothetical protein [Halobacterium bonnevillei]MXR20224.1 hypothetical protein [Halobacterium bonnevillei]